MMNLTGDNVTESIKAVLREEMEAAFHEERNRLQANIAELEKELALAIHLLNLYEVHTEGENGGTYDAAMLSDLIRIRDEAERRSQARWPSVHPLGRHRTRETNKEAQK